MPALWLSAASTFGWFGNMRYWTPIVHKDDHRHLARQALCWLIKSGRISRASLLLRHRDVIERSCGLLDIVEKQFGEEAPGELEWDYSHLYDPVARRGIDDRRFVNALQEFESHWRRALADAGRESHAEAARFLGYCCHLLQDMAVPAHVHCVTHGLSNRTADNLELTASAKRFYLREPIGPPYPGDTDAHVELFIAMGLEARGREATDIGEENEIAEILRRYYSEPGQAGDGWHGTYHGKFYHPYHRLLPSSPKIKLGDRITLRNFLMTRAAERTAQLIEHFALVTGTGVPAPGHADEGAPGSEGAA